MTCEALDPAELLWVSDILLKSNLLDSVFLFLFLSQAIRNCQAFLLRPKNAPCLGLDKNSREKPIEWFALVNQTWIHTEAIRT